MSGSTDGRLARGEERRARIAAAVVEAIHTDGVEGLTHRRVAAAAGVPLASTTYHFQTRDDLLEAGLRLAAERHAGSVRDWSEGIDPDGALADQLAAFVIDQMRTRHAHTVAEYELYLATRRRPALRPIATAWDDDLVRILTPRAGGEIRARLLVYAMDGIAIDALMRGVIPPVDDLRALFAEIVGP